MLYSPRTLPLAAFALGVALAAAPASARVFTPAPDTLRAAITAANESPGPDVIVLGPGIYPVPRGSGEDLNADGDLDVLDDLTIAGAGADRSAIEGSFERVLDVHAGATVEILGVAIRYGRQAAGNGGGIRNAGRLTLTRVQVSGNGTEDGAGGGIFSGGTGSSLTLTESAVTSNTATTVGGGLAVAGLLVLTDSTVSTNGGSITTGGGIHTFDGSDARIEGSTITGNFAVREGGGLYAASTPSQSPVRPVLRNTILAANTAPADRDCGGAPASAGHNLLGTGGACLDFSAAKGDRIGTASAPLDPRLGPLANNGGPTLTHALLPGSPALDAGTGCSAVDQRGVLRPAAACDIGAFELDPTACRTGGPVLCLGGDRFRVAVSFKTVYGSTGSGQAVQLTPGTGYVWFFDPGNVELTIKALDGCGVNGRFWIFLSGLTNVEVTVQVTDTATGAARTYRNPQGRTFRTVLDTGAFTCG
jgi:Right handed beta helix region